MTSTRPVRGARRAARLTAQVAILATVLGGTTAFTTLHKTVTVEVDGELRTASGFARTVGDVLASQRIDVSPGDVVLPDLTSAIGDGDLIVVRSVRDLDVEIDGEHQTIQTSALTVGEVLDELGPRTTGAQVSASRSDVLGRDRLRISTLKDVVLVMDGQQIPITTAEDTVRGVLLAAGVVLGEQDVVSEDLDAPTASGQVITVGRAADGSDTVVELVPFAVEEISDPRILAGQRTVSQTGVVGQTVTTYDIVQVDGAEVSRSIVAQHVTVEPRTEIVRVGTLELPDPATVKLDPGTARALGQAQAAERGWGDDQFACLDSLWTKESRWNVTAANPSGAYGIPQALPGSKMASAGADWQTNAATQITWGLGYIAGRYGTPCSAWAHSVAKNWY